MEFAFGPPLPTCAVHKVVSYLRYWRRAGRTAAIAVFDPQQTFALLIPARNIESSNPLHCTQHPACGGRGILFCYIGVSNHEPIVAGDF